MWSSTAWRMASGLVEVRESSQVPLAVGRAWLMWMPTPGVRSGESLGVWHRAVNRTSTPAEMLCRGTLVL